MNNTDEQDRAPRTTDARADNGSARSPLRVTLVIVLVGLVTLFIFDSVLLSIFFASLDPLLALLIEEAIQVVLIASVAAATYLWMRAVAARQRSNTIALEGVIDAVPMMFHRSIDHGDGTVTRAYRRCSPNFPLQGLTSPQTHPKTAILDVIHPDDRDHVLATWGRATDANLPYDLTTRIIGDDGEHHWIRYSATPTRLANGDVQWDGIGIDVTSERTLRESLETERQTMERLTEATTDHVVIFDRAGQVSFASRQMLADFGFAREACLGRRIDRLIKDRDDLTHAMSIIDGAMDSGETVRFEGPGDLGFGERHWSTVITPLRNHDQRVEGALLVARDMSERHEARRAQSIAERRFEAIFRESDVGVMIAEADGRITDLNPAACELLGRSPGEVKRLGLYGIFIQSDLEECIAEFEVRLRAGDRSYHTTKRALHPDGEIRWLSETVSLVRDERGEVEYLVLVLEDSTAEVIAKQRLAQSEARYRSLFENAAAWMVIVSSDGFVVETNQACANAFGRPLEEMRGLDVFLAIHPDDRQRAKTAFEEIRTTTESRVAAAVRFVAMDGTIIHTAVSLGAFRHGPRNEWLISAAVADISDREIAIERERTSEARFRAAIESSHDGFKIAEPIRDDQGRITDFRYLEANHAGCEMLGTTRNAVVGRTTLELWPFVKSTNTIATYARVIETGEPTSYELETNGDLPVEWLQVDLRSLDGNLVVSYRDISERKRSEQQLESLASRLDAATRGAGVGVWELDLGSNALSWTPTMFDLYGIDRSAFAGTFNDWARVVHPADAERVMKELAKATSSGTELRSQFRIIRPSDGATRDIAVISVTQRNQQGVPDQVVGVNIDVTEREQQRRELESLLKRHRLLLDELDHRTRNMLAALLSLVDLSSDSTEGSDSLRTRIESMATSHRVLSDAHWEPIGLRQLIELLMPTCACADGISIEGPDVLIPARQVTPFAVVLNELTSNAMKHGACSAERGRLEVDWCLREPSTEAGRALILRWRETGLEEDAEPFRTGLGLNLIAGFTRSELRGSHTVRSLPRGLEHRFEFRLDDPPANESAAVVETRAEPAPTTLV